MIGHDQIDAQVEHAAQVRLGVHGPRREPHAGPAGGGDHPRVDRAMVHAEVAGADLARPADRLRRLGARGLEPASRDEQHGALRAVELVQPTDRRLVEGLDGGPLTEAPGRQRRQHLLLDAGIAPAAARRLDLRQHLDRRPRRVEDLGQRRYGLVRHAAVAPTQTQRAQLCQRRVGDGAVARGRALQRGVVDHDRLAIGREMDVELQDVDAERDGAAEGHRAVLRPQGGAAAMRRDEPARTGRRGGHQSEDAEHRRERADHLSTRAATARASRPATATARPARDRRRECPSPAAGARSRPAARRRARRCAPPPGARALR